VVTHSARSYGMSYTSSLLFDIHALMRKYIQWAVE
jgi:hypothetical protein